MDRLSVIVPNHNYRDFVEEAVRSALDLEWPDVEVIVVDDGSTDDSLQVLEQFGARITLLTQANAGQRSAADRGFAASTGDVVLFLDSDDVLPPGLPAVLDRAMRQGVSKVQFQMQRIDADGVPIGTPFPDYKPLPQPADVRRWFLATSAYPTPPGSGNAYPRWFLDATIPRHAGIDAALDSTLVAAAPVLGDVVSVPGVLVRYRQHGRNDSRLLVGSGRFGREVRRAQARWRFAQSVSESPLPGGALRRSRELLQFRVAAWRVEAKRGGLPADSGARLLTDIVRSPLAPGPDGVGRRLAIAAFCFALLVAPVPVVHRLLRLRFGRGLDSSPPRPSTGPRSSETLRLSFVIPNYNYGRFLSETIASALAVDWPDVEVIVVDDGSTDDSVAVAAEFGARIRLMRQANQGPRVACNAGFAASTGDLMVFLDSDDTVQPEIRSAIDGAWRAGVSKLQFQMQRIDVTGAPIGRPFPALRRVPSPDQIRRWMRTTAAYPTPPGSGNVYARDFLEAIFPLDDSCGDAIDSACLAAAPFLGDVVTVPRPLFSYRVHGANRSDLTLDTHRFTTQIERALQRHAFAQRIDGKRDREGWIEPLFRGGRLLEMRIAQLRLTNEPSPLPGDGRSRMLLDVVRSATAPGPDSIALRVARAVWCVSALLGPTRLTRRLVTLRYSHR